MADDEDFKTQEGTHGFLATEFRRGQTHDGELMITALAGQERWLRKGPKQYEKQDPVMFPIVQYGDKAEHTLEKYKPGDHFVAEGVRNTRTYTNRDGEEVSRTEFVIRSIGPDSAKTRYDVDRTPRNRAAQRDTPAAEQAPAAESPSESDPEPARRDASSARSPRSKKLASFPGPGEGASAPVAEPVGADIPF